MEETTGAAVGVEVDAAIGENGSDAFEEGWDSAEDTDVYSSEDDGGFEGEAEEDAEENAEEGGEGAAEAEGDEQPEEPEPGAEEGEQPAQQPPAQQTWEVNGQQLNEGQMRQLAGMGMAYTGLQQQLAIAQPVMELMNRQAQKKGMSTPDYINHLRAKEYAGDNHVSLEQAQQAIALEDREKTVRQHEARQQAQRNRQNSIQAQNDNQLRLFAMQYPDVFAQGPDAIPQSVWDEVRKGQLLPVAYAHYVNSQLAAAQRGQAVQESAQEQNEKNRARSAGSMRTAGNTAANKDPFLQGWDE